VKGATLSLSAQSFSMNNGAITHLTSPDGSDFVSNTSECDGVPGL
jgi:hypothetical protein